MSGPLFRIIGYLWLSMDSVQSLKVFRNTLNLSHPNPIGGARVIGPLVNMTDITICIRFHFQLLGGWEGKSQLIAIEDWRETDSEPPFKLLWFGANYPTSFFGFGHPQTSSYLLQDPETNRYDLWIPNKWTHVCLSFEKRTNYLRMVKDGVTLNIDFEDPLLDKMEIPPDFLNKTFIGRCSYDFKGGCSTPGGLLSDFNIWDRALSEEDLKSWTTCGNMLKGNVVNWDETSFELENMVVEDIAPNLVCKPLRPGHVLFPEEKNMSQALNICQKMRGQISVVTSELVQKELIDLWYQNPNASDYGTGFYGGWWDVETEGTFENINTKEKLLDTDYQPWYFGEPNGNTLENCQTVWPYRNSWNDLSCSYPAASFCEFERAPYLQLRGLCFESLFDSKFSWTGELINGRHSFNGFTDSRLFWVSTLDQWRIELLSDPGTFAVLNSDEYPFGTQEWNFTGDTCSLGEERNNSTSSLVTLNFNACQGEEFNCLDGHCVPVQSRCNGRIDCSDRSDEFDCAMVTIDRSYIKHVPAPPEEGIQLTRINVSVDVLSVLDISEVDSRITLQFQLSLSWFDPRLVFSNLKTNAYLNTLSLEDKSKLWIPQTVFYNTETMEESTNDDKSFTTVQRLGHFEESPVFQLENTHYYKGSENPLTISRVYSVQWICNFDMGVYPFDTQKCQSKFIMKGNSGNFAELQLDTLRYLGPIDLTQYFVKGSSFTRTQVTGDIQAIQIEIVLGRRILSQILTTYLPTFLICIVSFSTNYFKAFFFEAVVTVNLTSLLVLTTLFISVSDSLPKTSYIKMIDIWLLFSLFIPFCEVILHTFIDSLREEAVINHHGRPNTVKVKQRMPEVSVNSKVIAIPKISQISIEERLMCQRGLVARDEHVEVEARKSLYRSLIISQEKLLHACTVIAKKGLPLFYVAFAIVYFGVGMYFRQLEQGTMDRSE